MTDPGGAELTGLLAAFQRAAALLACVDDPGADHSLYRAKQAGRNRVVVS